MRARVALLIAASLRSGARGLAAPRKKLPTRRVDIKCTGCKAPLFRYAKGNGAGSKLVKIYDERIVKVDTVRAYHFGAGFLVEVDVVLPESMTLREAHDIGESLQMKIEALELTERCFVHLDYEWNHAPEH